MSILTNPYYTTSVDATSAEVFITSDFTGGQGLLKAVVNRNPTPTFDDFVNYANYNTQEITIVAAGEYSFVFQNLLPGETYYAHFVEDDGTANNRSAIVSIPGGFVLDEVDGEVYLLPRDMQTRQRISASGGTNIFLYLADRSHGFVNGDFVDIVHVGDSGTPITVEGFLNFSSTFAPKGNTLTSPGDYIRATLDADANRWDLDFYGGSGVRVTDTFITDSTEDTNDEFTEGVYTGITNLVLANGLRARQEFVNDEAALRITTVMRPVNLNPLVAGDLEAWVLNAIDPDDFGTYNLIAPFGQFTEEPLTAYTIRLRLRNVSRDPGGNILTQSDQTTLDLPPYTWTPSNGAAPGVYMVGPGLVEVSVQDNGGEVPNTQGRITFYPDEPVPTFVDINMGGLGTDLLVTYGSGAFV